ncbi:MAG: glyoxalase/bleomycin resistance/extradiol dioxygenase family protein [Acidobacteria bacterium]|nr:glyoxalase/bleomycin resistance/extradiol dioxygenase family protein [Acidobacteriota bacterium]
MTPALESVHPVLMSSDVTASIAFYGLLGFRATFQDQPVAPSYAALTRDAVTLHLQWHADAQRSGDHDRPVYRFVCSQVDDLYEEFLIRGGTRENDPAASPFAKPADTPWGTREFHLRDPDGNGLQFYRSL